MGAVFLARDTTLHRHVALKVLGAAGDTGTIRDRLLREARTAAALNRQGICTVYEVGEAEGRAFIAMEYVGRISRQWLITHTATLTPRAYPAGENRSK